MPYSLRIIVFSALSACGILLIALTPSYTDGGTNATKMAVVILASLSSGGGELSFLGLTHFYGPFSLAAWGSGTGGVGLVGAGLYSLATTTLGLSAQNGLFASSFLPIVMLVGFFIVLPQAPSKRRRFISTSDDQGTIPKHDSDAATSIEEDPLLGERAEDGLLSRHGSKTSIISSKMSSIWYRNFLRNIRRARGLFLP